MLTFSSEEITPTHTKTIQSAAQLKKGGILKKKI
jgi:hypothetical protein